MFYYYKLQIQRDFYQDDKKSLLVTRYMTTLRVELSYLIKEWGHILQDIKQENGH